MASLCSRDARGELVRVLKQQLGQLQGPRRRPDETVSTSGCAGLDRLLPGEGFRRGTLVEWLADRRGSGVGTLAIMAAREACAEGGALVVLDPRRRFYPPAAVALGIDLASLIVVRPTGRQDELWALDQVLRSEAVGAVWGPLSGVDGRSYRRLQLAAESGGTLGLLLRPARVIGQPSWSHVRLLVEPRPFRDGPCMRVEVVHRFGGANGGAVELEIDETTGGLREVKTIDETHPLHLVSLLAHPAAAHRAARTLPEADRALHSPAGAGGAGGGLLAGGRILRGTAGDAPGRRRISGAG